MTKLEFSGFVSRRGLACIAALCCLALVSACSPPGIPTEQPIGASQDPEYAFDTDDTAGGSNPATGGSGQEPGTTPPGTSPQTDPGTPMSGDAGDAPAGEQQEPTGIGQSGGGQAQPASAASLVVWPDRLELSAGQPWSQILIESQTGALLSYTVTCSENWLTANPTAGSVAAETDVVTITAYADGLRPGQHEATVTIGSPGLAAQTVQVVLTVPEPPMRTIGGWIRRGTTPLADILVTVGPWRTLTDVNGYFSVQVPDGWSGAVTPSDVNYQFDPPSLSFQAVHRDFADNTFAAARLAPRVPNFAFRDLEYHNIRTYYGPQPQGTIDDNFSYVATFDNQCFYAELRWLGDDAWELALTPRVAAEELCFPHEITETVLNGDLSDDVLFVTQYTGAAWKFDVLSPSFAGPVYPGSAFAPLLVQSDGTTARMAAAINWPPQRVKTAFARGRFSLMYGTDALPQPGQTAVYRLIYTQSSGAEDLGLYAWQRLVDKYKRWLAAAATSDGIFPIRYPQWLREADGLINVHLEGFSDAAFARDDLINIWRTWKHILPIMLMWGVTSPHDPEHGCCNPPPPYVHERYLPRLLELAAEITQDGHLAYYSRVFNGQLIDGRTPESAAGLAFLVDWIRQNLANGANIAYIDVLGADYFGDARTIAQFFINLFPEGTFIEYPVDVYPAAFWICNNIYGSGYYASGPGYTDCLEALVLPPYRVTYPRFGRYILDDRIMFLGTGNNELIYWGQENDHWLERQVFLLGLKFDVHHSLIEEPRGSGQLNYAMNLAITERQRVNWWQRKPRYCDRAGIRQIPSGIDIRRFVDEAGINLFVIDNWSQVEGQSFVFNNRTIEIPASPLSILELSQP